jgi:hypothetical protein
MRVGVMIGSFVKEEGGKLEGLFWINALMMVPSYASGKSSRQQRDCKQS